MKKKKILLLGDDIRVVSGVSIICRNLILKGASKFDWVQLAAQTNNPDNNQIIDVSDSVNKIADCKDSYVRLYCSSGYGNQDVVRRIISQENIDCILHITDPRRWNWLYKMEHEIRKKIPLCYYHVWDNYPIPKYNKNFYDSCDFIGCISKLTHNCVREVSPNVESKYIPHGIDTEVFNKIENEISIKCKTNILPTGCDFLVFCNNVNIPRKQLPLLIKSFALFCDKIGKVKSKKTALMIHTNPTNNAGANLLKLVDDLYKEYNILFSNSVVENKTLCQMYNTADVTINIASNEGFGLSTAESLSCGTPVIVNDTGGLSEQVDDNNTWGIKIKPCYTNLIGSISSPYVNESLCSEKDVSEAIFTIYSKTPDERNTMGIAGRKYIQKNYNINEMCNNLYEGLNDTMSNFIPKETFSFTKII